LVKGPTEHIYIDTELEFFLNSEDMRLLDVKHAELQVRKSKRHAAVPKHVSKTYTIDENELIETLKARCYTP
jgi:hypothetical protein